jgi:hypothetical protein
VRLPRVQQDARLDKGRTSILRKSLPLCGRCPIAQKQQMATRYVVDRRSIHLLCRRRKLCPPNSRYFAFLFSLFSPLSSKLLGTRRCSPVGGSLRPYSPVFCLLCLKSCSSQLCSPRAAPLFTPYGPPSRLVTLFHILQQDTEYIPACTVCMRVPGTVLCNKGVSTALPH